MWILFIGFAPHLVHFSRHLHALLGILSLPPLSSPKNGPPQSVGRTPMTLKVSPKVPTDIGVRDLYYQDRMQVWLDWTRILSIPGLVSAKLKRWMNRRKHILKEWQLPTRKYREGETCYSYDGTKLRLLSASGTQLSPILVLHAVRLSASLVTSLPDW